MTPPLSGHDARILELLLAGRSFDDVCEIGRHRKTWPPSAVHRIVNQWLTRPAEPTRAPRKGKFGPPPMELQHGTESGYRLHIKRRIPMCDPCRVARSIATRDRRKTA